MKTITEFLDMPETICEEQGVLNAVLCNDDDEFPVSLPYKIEGDDFEVYVDKAPKVKDIWEPQMMDDLVHAKYLLSRMFPEYRDLNLIIGNF